MCSSLGQVPPVWSDHLGWPINLHNQPCINSTLTLDEANPYRPDGVLIPLSGQQGSSLKRGNNAAQPPRRCFHPRRYACNHFARHMVQLSFLAWGNTQGARKQFDSFTFQKKKQPRKSERLCCSLMSDKDSICIYRIIQSILSLYITFVKLLFFFIHPSKHFL